MNDAEAPALGPSPSDDDPTAGIGASRAGSRWPQVLAAVAAVFAAVIVTLALLRPDPLAAADDVRQAAATIGALATSDPRALDDRGTAAFVRQVDDGRIDLTALDPVAGYRAETPVVLDHRDDEARVLVVLRDEDRRRLELILLEDDGWRLDRFELY